jgi:hypothetical protein
MSDRTCSDCRWYLRPPQPDDMPVACWTKRLKDCDPRWTGRSYPDSPACGQFEACESGKADPRQKGLRI